MPLMLRVGEQTLPLVPNRRYVVGAAMQAELRIQHASIAPQHAEVELVGTKLRVRDLESATGTWHGDTRAISFEVPLGSEFRLGAIPIRFEQFVPSTAIAADAGVSHRFHEPSFHEIMADQLRRAPWFAISIVAHALLLLLLHLIFARDPESGEPERVFTLQNTDETENIVDEEVAEEPIEVEQQAEEVILTEVDVRSNFDAPESAAETYDALEAGTSWMGEDMFAKLGAKGGDDVLKTLEATGGAGEFKRKVGEIRQQGLDIVFVFDSTQSMTDVLDQTKNHIALMVDVLHALVPSSRIGIVTYRDHGKREEYLMRSVPLDDNYYRAINFMQTVQANGGGDFPEAVFEALELSIRLKWRKDSRRVVVLIGDAPAHDGTEQKLRNLVREFARDQRSFVHAIMTSADREGIDSETRKNFSMIADAGAGACIPLSDEVQILREVLSLAFGREFRRSIDDVYQIVEKRINRISASARDLVKRADLEGIRLALMQSPVDDDIVRALSKSRDPRVAHFLVKLLRTGTTPKSSRHAASYALQRMLELTQPPIDPEQGDLLDQSYAKRLTGQIDHRLN